LSSSDFIFTIDLAAVVSLATRTYPFPVSANEQSIVLQFVVVVVVVVRRGGGCCTTWA
jgi:hypothetical protein